MSSLNQIGFGGGCHWCTEAVFSSLKGICDVKQGWISSKPPYDEYSEAVLLYYDPAEISLSNLIEIHLHTHSADSDHTMRQKYRSAIYYLTEADRRRSEHALHSISKDFDRKLVTQVLPCVTFRLNKPEFQDYYYSRPEKPFCQTYIRPKLRLLLERFRSNTREDKIAAAISEAHS